MRAIFFGTPSIAVASLEALATIADVVGVVCQPDRPAGRGLEMKVPPVKQKALELGIEVVQPLKIRTAEFAAWVREKRADLSLVIAYGRILPKEVLSAPRAGSLNLHASLLPKYRGAAPITWAIVHGESETGISLMQMDEGMDTGPVFTRRAITIEENTTADELGVALGELAALVVRADVPRALAGELHATAQDGALATTARILEKADGRIDWTKPARAVHDHVRGMTSWPGAFTTAANKGLKVLATRVASAAEARGGPGTVVSAGAEGIEIACGAGSIAIVRAQVEGRKPLGARELWTGRALAAGMVLGGAG